MFEQWDITLAVDHIQGASLQETDDALSRYHLGSPYMDMLYLLLTDKGVSLHPIPAHLFTLSNDV